MCRPQWCFPKLCFHSQQGLLLLQQLTKSNAAIQKIVAFENAFERLLDIITEEGSSDGGKRSFSFSVRRWRLLARWCEPSLRRYCGGGLFAAPAQPAEEQQLQSELLQGGFLHPENEAVVWGRRWQLGLVRTEGHQRSPHAAGKAKRLCLSAAGAKLWIQQQVLFHWAFFCALSWYASWCLRWIPPELRPAVRSLCISVVCCSSSAPSSWPLECLPTSSLR